MNWIESISEAVNYIEENLEGDLKIEDIAGKAFISPFYFQKAFGMLCGFTVGEYIRNRRLANAGNDLLTTDEKIIDIAMKYGYDSPDSFTKAFTRFHGSTPTAVRKNGRTIKSYAPLKLNLLLKGGYIMDYRIEKRKAFSVVAKIDPSEKSITYIDDGNISSFDAFCLSTYLSDKWPEGSLYRVEKGEAEITDGFEEHRIPEFTWAVFKCPGISWDDAREKTWRQITDEWLPQTNYETVTQCFTTICNKSYAKDDEGNFGEIWVAVKEKR